MADTKVDDFIESIKNAIGNMVTLEIKTIVGAVVANDKGELVIDPKGNPKQIKTTIDLLQGDITTEIDPEFISGQYQALRTFHTDREKEGHDIINKNIDALKKLVDFARTSLK